MGIKQMLTELFELDQENARKFREDNRTRIESADVVSIDNTHKVDNLVSTPLSNATSTQGTLHDNTIYTQATVTKHKGVYLSQTLEDEEYEGEESTNQSINQTHIYEPYPENKTTLQTPRRRRQRKKKLWGRLFSLVEGKEIRTQQQEEERTFQQNPTEYISQQANYRINYNLTKLSLGCRLEVTIENLQETTTLTDTIELTINNAYHKLNAVVFDRELLNSRESKILYSQDYAVRPYSLYILSQGKEIQIRLY